MLKIKKILNKKFILLILISSFKISSLLYFIDFYKYFTMFYTNNDLITTISYSISSLSAFIGFISFPYLIKKYNFFEIYIINFILILGLNFILILNFKSKDPSIFLLTFLTRGILSFTYNLEKYSIFGLFSNKSGLLVSKIHDLYLLFASIIMSTINTYFYKEE